MTQSWLPQSEFTLQGLSLMMYLQPTCLVHSFFFLEVPLNTGASEGHSLCPPGRILGSSPWIALQDSAAPGKAQGDPGSPG